MYIFLFLGFREISTSLSVELFLCDRQMSLFSPLVILVDLGGTDVKGILSAIGKDEYLSWFVRTIERTRLEMALSRKNNSEKDREKDGEKKNKKRKDSDSQIAVIMEFKGVPASYVLSSSGGFCFVSRAWMIIA